MTYDNDVGTTGNTGIQCQPASLVAHDLDHHNTAMTIGCGVNTINYIGADIHGGMESRAECKSAGSPGQDSF